VIYNLNSVVFKFLGRPIVLTCVLGLIKSINFGVRREELLFPEVADKRLLLLSLLRYLRRLWLKTLVRI
jgi:hypothetical protein